MRITWRFLFDVVIPAFLVCWIAGESYAAAAGPQSFRALRGLEAEAGALRETVIALETRRAALERHARQLHPRSLDPDLVEEKIRSVLGYAAEGDVIIPADEVRRLVEQADAAARSGARP